MRERPLSTVAALHGVTKRYGPVTALENVDLALYAGEVLALLGPNGAGKSTALGLLTGRLLPGAAVWAGPDADGGAAADWGDAAGG